MIGMSVQVYMLINIMRTIGRVSNSGCTTIAAVAATLAMATYGLGVAEVMQPVLGLF